MRRIWLAVALLVGGCGGESFDIAPAPDVAESETALSDDTGVADPDTAVAPEDTLTVDPDTGSVEAETGADTDASIEADAGGDADADASADVATDASRCDVMVSCYTDKDGDGFAPGGAATFLSCVCPAGSTAKSPSITIDCNDEDPRVFPGNPAFYPDPYCVPGTSCAEKSYDYNCNSVVEKQYGVLNTCPSGCGGAGFPSVLECGATATLNYCVKELVCSKKTAAGTRQGCH